MTANELRSGFLTYFEARGHRIVASSPLIPHDDPTLLFANAGMNQFKDIFLGRRAPDFRRAASSQKCIRAGGKHNDLEDVGKDGTHHTFFEMLGNWSFGDYYKAEAIEWAWDFLINVLRVPADRMWATVHHTDDEAEELWRKIVGLPKGRIIRLGDEDNFWEMADVGPCGPCSEIHYDLDPGPGKEWSEDRTVELWNLVFMQYYRDESGNLTPLPEKHVDTGAGFERLVAVVQEKRSNYDTDVFTPIIAAVEEKAGRRYSGSDEDAPFRIIADHLRSLAFAITDGGFPSNVGRGYVLRRILRRASRAGRQIGLTEPFLHELTASVVDAMGEAFPELRQRREHVETVIRREEEQFGRTLNRGIDQFEELADGLVKRGESVIPGDQVFRLYDTYGVPVDLTALMAEERGLSLDAAGYEEKMTEQRQRSRSQAKFDQGTVAVAENLASEFVGYDTLGAPAQVIGVAPSEKEGRSALVLDQTPFYAESGGQIGDRGTIVDDEFEFVVSDVQKQGDAIVHLGAVKRGTPKVGMSVRAEVDEERRGRTIRNHSATHLLQAALRSVLGEGVHQAGSLVAPERLRFDFTYGEAVRRDQLKDIEGIVNARVRDDLPVSAAYAPIEEAKAAGAMALFGEKYGDTVRVVKMGDVSMELCGGTHVRSTGQIGLFRILSEGGIAAGTRRIEGVTGVGAEEIARAERERLERVSAMLKATPDEVESRVSSLLDRIRDLERELERTRTALSRTDVDRWIAEAGQIGGVKVLVQEVALPDVKAFRALGDSVREKLGTGVALLINREDDKLALMTLVTDDLTKKVQAGKLVVECAAIIGGRGGGRPHMAEAGGGDVAKLAELLAKAPDIIAGYLS